MKVSVSLVIDPTEEYRIGFETIESGFLPLEIFDYLNKESIEIVEVLLDRVKGSDSTSIAILTEMTNIIHRLFVANENAILYFFCDDLNEIPNTDKDIAPQEYRSRLFTAMFDRFVTRHGIEGINNVSVCIDAIGRTEYLHFIVRNHHLKYVDFIRENIEQIYTK